MIQPRARGGADFSGLKIGLLGGSFNPAHGGHLEMSLHALKRLKLDQIWWLVSPQNPLKETKDMAGLAARVAGAKRLAAKHPRLIVTALEGELGTRYTADTLRALKRRFPRARFVWLMGADNLRQIPRWKNWADIFRMAPVAVFRRPAYPLGRGLGKAAIRFGRSRRQAGQNLQAPAWVMLDNRLNDISATKIRKDDPSWQKRRKRQ